MEDLRDHETAERLEAHEPDAFHSRREFLQKTAVTAGLTASLGLALTPDTVVAEAARVQRRVALPSPRNMPIDTIVVLMMENRSFDHYLGWYPGADGRQAGLSFPDKLGAMHPTHRLVNAAGSLITQPCGFLDPDHSWDGGRAELNGGKLDGFLRVNDELAIGYYLEHDLPFTPSNANEFTVFDRFFCSLLGSTYPNREYMWAGQSFGRIDNSLPISTSELGLPDTTIFSALEAAGVSATYFFCDIPFSALFGRSFAKRSQPVQDFYALAALGKLPHVCFVDPSFTGEEQGTSGDEHPLGDIRVGQAWMADVVNACIESPQWKNMAVFCVYDEWGGFFDHVVPPRVPDIRADTASDRDFGQMGFRIPAILTSPYARKGYVDHSIYGFESILKMIRYRFGLAPLTTRDLFANNIAYAFDFNQAPRVPGPQLTSPKQVLLAGCQGGLPDAALDGGALIGTTVGTTTGLPLPTPLRKPHDLYSLVTSGYLERLGFQYKPATAETMFRHPSSLGLK